MASRDMQDLIVRSAKKGEQSIIANLLRLYLHDFSEFERVEIDRSGSFSYPYLDHYWQDPNRYPFLFRLEQDLTGFALLRFNVDPLKGIDFMDLSEFFVLRGLRRTGVGGMAAAKLFDLFPGRWQVRVLLANKAAMSFWRTTIAGYTGDCYQEKKADELVQRWTTFLFDNGTDLVFPQSIDLDISDF